MKVCVIGAGVSGLACCVMLKKYNIDFVCFEKSNCVGGIWNYSPDLDNPSVYQNCTLNHSNKVMVYPFRKVDIKGRHFAHRSGYFNYLQETSDEFGLYQHIKFNTEVKSLQKLENGSWCVSTNDETEQIFEHVIVCAGFYSNGYIPQEYVKSYMGNYIHSSEYRAPAPFKDQKVLVVGSGSSAIQIACDLANVANDVKVSVRNMPFIIPKFLMGKPYSAIYLNIIKKFPRKLQSRYLEFVIKLINGKQESYGIPSPSQRLLDGRLPISQDIFDKTASGMIRFRPAIKKLENYETTFTDDSHEKFDHIIFSTGYKVSLPFLKDLEFDVNRNYKFISNMDHNHLYFCGYLQPIGPVPPVVTTQANYIARIIAGDIQLPEKEEQHSYMRQFFEQLKLQFSQEFNGRIHINDYLDMLMEDMQ
ncbi:flavin-containing monooxygenase [Pleionea sediminis]|uniref:flavin-containing monooxygenase n=1 Tax=Pleionea sediminis TaxID=2569479 RepID=UPI0013DE1218|nr:NAD(P)-binding domain-containing protein [Pleionea sediminis]